jgi:hypothetical protein
LPIQRVPGRLRELLPTLLGVTMGGVDASAARDDQLSADARAAFQRCDWVGAFEAYRIAAAAAASLSVDELERGAEAAVWVGEWDASIEFRQRAFADCIANGQEHRAAGLAIHLVFDNATRHRFAVALGWLARAERLLEGCEPCSELGRLVELRAMEALEVRHDATSLGRWRGRARHWYVSAA